MNTTSSDIINAAPTTERFIVREDNTTIPEGLATSQQVAELTDALSETNERWKDCEDSLTSAKEALEGTVESLEGTQSAIISAKSDFVKTLEDGAKCELVGERIHRNDSREIKKDIKAVRGKLDALSFPEDTTINESITTLDTAIQSWRKERENISDKIRSLLPRTTAHELGKDYADTRKSTDLRWHYAGIMATIMVYAVLTIFSIINDSLAGIYIPLLPLSAVLYLLIQQIQQKTRMDEEYRHKETLMKTYVGFSQNLEQKDEIYLDAVTIESIARNPASTISRNQGVNLKLSDLNNLLYRKRKIEESENDS